jgi:hypothetical protein
MPFLLGSNSVSKGMSTGGYVKDFNALVPIAHMNNLVPLAFKNPSFLTL